MNEGETIIKVPLDSIKMNPFQPREEFEAATLAELSESIKNHGIIHPIIIRKAGNQYQLIAGERRLRAAKLIGLKDIPAIIKDVDGIEVAELSLIENLQRKDLNPLEEACAYNILQLKFGLTQEEISQRVGKSRSEVANVMRLLNLPQNIKDSISSGEITKGHARAMLSIKDEDEIQKVFKKVKEKNLSVRQTEILVQNILMKKEKIFRKKQNIKRLIKDVRIIVNTIREMIKSIKKVGGIIESEEEDTGDYIKFTIKLKKIKGIGEK